MAALTDLVIFQKVHIIPFEKQDLRNTVSYYERKAESYIDRRAANSSRAMANDIKLQKADDEYNAFVNSPANKKLVKDFFNATDTAVKSKFPELGEVESLNVVNAREYSKTKYFILKTAKSKFLIMHTDFELVDATFSSREEAVSKTKELDRHSA